MKPNAQRQRRSERLSPEEYRAFKKQVASIDTKLDAAEAIGFSVNTLDAILLKGTGHPDSIKKIRDFLSNTTTA